MQPSSSFSCTPQPPGLGHQLRLPLNVEDLHSRPFQDVPSVRETGAAAGTGLLLVLCWHLPAAMGDFRAADTPGTTEGPTGVLWGCAGARSCFSRNQHLHKSPAPALPCPGGCGPGLGHAGSVVGHAGLSRPSRGPCGAGAPRRHHCHLPLRRDPAGHKATHCCDSSWPRSDRDAWAF